LVLSGCGQADPPFLQLQCGFHLEIASPASFGKYVTQFAWCRNYMDRIRPSCSFGYVSGTEFAGPF
ncbi:MAG: hypothetical protein L7W94_09315, partial [Alphaproteobacteria bacterium]|nr:hypothetical protein [Alphaproteobacteria bacterium]